MSTSNSSGKTFTIRGIEITITNKFLIISALALVFIILIIVIIALALRKTSPNCEQSPQSSTCNTADCYSYAAELVNSLNTSIKPCDNFYEFACGKWIENAEVDDTQEWENKFQQQDVTINKRLRKILESTTKDSGYLDKAQSAYVTCMEQKEDVELKKLYTEIVNITKGFPLVEPDYQDKYQITDKDKLLQFLVPLRRQDLNSGVLFSLAVMNDFFNNNNSILVLNQPTLIFGREVKLIIALCKKFSDKCDETHSQESAAKINFLVNQLANISDSSSENFTEIYNTKSISEFTELTNGINWLGFFNKLFENIHTFEPTHKIAILNIAYFQRLASLIVQDNTFDFLSVINLEILFTMFAVGTKQTGISNFQDVLLTSNFKVTSPRHIPSWLVCVQSVSSWYRVGLAVEIAKQYYDIEKDVKSVEELTESLTNIFHERLNDLTWLDESSRQMAKMKLDYMKHNYLFPKWAYDTQNLEKFYENIEKKKTHVENYLHLLQFMRNKNFNKLKTPKDKLEDWVINSLVPNAVYHQLSNSMFISTAILHHPVFDSDRLYAMKFGGIGYVIGHEITHGFDLSGTQFNYYGNLQNWLTDQVYITFQEKSQCFKDQYSQYFLTPEELPTLTENAMVNGTQTASENIADNGGLQQAFWAYQKWKEVNGPEIMPDLLKNFTAEQIFFISFSQYWCIKYSYSKSLEYKVLLGKHSPPKFRVIGTLANFNEFNKAFHCPEIDESKVCKLW